MSDHTLMRETERKLVYLNNIRQGFSRSMGVLSIAEFRKLDLSPMESALVSADSINESKGHNKYLNSSYTP